MCRGPRSGWRRCRNIWSPRSELHEDFWLYDDEIGVRMFYDNEGHFLYPELIDDLGPYREMRDTALRHAEPLTDYLARKGLTRETLRMTG